MESLCQQFGVWVPVGLIVGLMILGYTGAKYIIWSLFITFGIWSLSGDPVLSLIIASPFLIMNVPAIRRVVLSNNVMRIMEAMKLMPVISETERVALEAGSTWVDAELFSGKPNFQRIRSEPYPKLSAEEQSFIDNQVEHLCNMVTDWDVYNHKDLPKEVWDYIKKEKFLGMIIPKKYGGLEFSALGHSEVVAKLAGRSTTLCVSIMVPNSLGPAELLNHYGTEKQKDYYLPRLARGEEIPCFALTEPNAGSDAGSIESSGVVFKGDDGQLYIRLNWDKRYITLAAISTVIGLAVKLRDPDNLLGKGEDLGITCLLVPSDAKGVELGLRHNPMGVPFYNCPTRGRDVVVSVEQIMGGVEGAGIGWKMLMESLASGRAISLPSQAAGGVKLVSAIASAYSVVRRQFGVSIGKFEGIEEPLARIVGNTYMMEAMRRYTVGAVDSGLKPAVVSAIAKYMGTETARKVINDGMDILGGAAISRGPKNLIANAYTGMPISITVEGANILTRSMIIFGQGAIRCHPYAYKEVGALMAKDTKAFDHAFWGHIGHVVRNKSRSILLSLTRGHLASVPSGPASRWYRKLAWASASYAIMSDIAMGSLGGALKMKEKLTGRYADALMWMYLATCTLRRYEAEGYQKEHRDVFEWSMNECFYRIQIAFDGIFRNFDAPIPGLGLFFKGPIAFWSSLNKFASEPSDALGHKVASAIQKPGAFRDAIIDGVFIPANKKEQGHALEHTFVLSEKSEDIYGKIRKAVRAKTLPKGRPTALVGKALAAGVISKEEADLLEETNRMRQEVIQVDEFSLEDFQPQQLDLKPEAASKYT